MQPGVPTLGPEHALQHSWSTCKQHQASSARRCQSDVYHWEGSNQAAMAHEGDVQQAAASVVSETADHPTALGFDWLSLLG